MNGDEFRLLRAVFGLTSEDMARLMGADVRSVRRWQAGGPPVPVGLVMELMVEHVHMRHHASNVDAILEARMGKRMNWERARLRMRETEPARGGLPLAITGPRYPGTKGRKRRLIENATGDFERRGGKIKRIEG